MIKRVVWVKGTTRDLEPNLQGLIEVSLPTRHANKTSPRWVPPIFVCPTNDFVVVDLHQTGSRVHELKCHPEEFDAVKRGLKRFEFRKDDRAFAVGDVLRLRKYEPKSKRYMGEEWLVRVTFILRGPAFDVPEGYVVLSIEDIPAGIV